MYKKVIGAITLASVITLTATAGMMHQAFASSNVQELPEDDLLLSPPSKGLVITQPFFMNIVIPCDSKTTMAETLGNEKYQEIPFSTGDGSMTVMMAPGQQNRLPGVIKIWANPNTWSFSITIEDPNPANDVMCMLTNGKELRPIPTKSKGDDL